MNATLRAGILVVGISLVGCATRQTAPGTVPKPIAIPCEVPVPPRPEFPYDLVGPDADLFTLGTRLEADRKTRQAYELQLEIALQACTKR